MARLGLGGGRRRSLLGGLVPAPPSPTPAPTPPPALAGFARNGAANAATRAMLARVRSGSGRGKIVMKGDSTTVGQGAGTAADPHRLTGARLNRPAAVLAAGLTAAGVPALDGSFVGDNGLGLFATVPLPVYDPRVALGTDAWSFYADASFAGAAFMINEPGAIGSFTPEGHADRFEVVYYNAQPTTYQFTIDGDAAAIASGPASVTAAAGSGYSRASLAAATAAPHALQFACPGAHWSAAVTSVTAYDSTVPAIDLKVDAALGATSADQSASGNGWKNLDHLVWEAPDLTIVNLGLNDMALGVGASAYAANLDAIVTAARASGDVLLVFPYPCSPSYASLASQTAFRDAAAALAQARGAALLSLFDYFGGGFSSGLQARMADGIVHGDAGLYAEVAGAYRQAIMAMAA